MRTRILPWILAISAGLASSFGAFADPVVPPASGAQKPEPKYRQKLSLRSDEPEVDPDRIDVNPPAPHAPYTGPGAAGQTIILTGGYIVRPKAETEYASENRPLGLGGAYVFGIRGKRAELVELAGNVRTALEYYYEVEVKYVHKDELLLGFEAENDLYRKGFTLEAGRSLSNDARGRTIRLTGGVGSARTPGDSTHGVGVRAVATLDQYIRSHAKIAASLEGGAYTGDRQYLKAKVSVRISNNQFSNNQFNEESKGGSGLIFFVEPTAVFDLVSYRPKSAQPTESVEAASELKPALTLGANVGVALSGSK